MRRTVEEAEKTRLALCEAALKAFAEEGWRGATFEVIAAKAGVTRGALNHHFKDKKALLSSALVWGWDKYAESLFPSTTATDGNSDNATKALTKLLTQYLQLLSTDPLFKALASTTVLVAPMVWQDTTEKIAGLAAWHQHLQALISADPTVKNPLPNHQIAGLILILLQGLTVCAVTNSNNLPHPEHQAAAVAGLVQGVLN